jgi:hypothetical protein
MEKAHCPRGPELQDGHVVEAVAFSGFLFLILLSCASQVGL